jgi:hypothetical protein
MKRARPFERVGTFCRAAKAMGDGRSRGAAWDMSRKFIATGEFATKSAHRFD